MTFSPSSPLPHALVGPSPATGAPHLPHGTTPLARPARPSWRPAGHYLGRARPMSFAGRGRQA